MISAILLATGDDDTPENVRECAVLSLVWLVSAVVGGVVRDVTAACPPSWPIEDVMDHAGCALIRQPREAERLANAAALVRCERVLVLRMGFQPEGPLVAEIDALERRLAPDDSALLLQAPSRLIERLFPDRAPVVGVLVSRQALSGSTRLGTLARAAGSGIRMRSRMVPVL